MQNRTLLVASLALAGSLVAGALQAQSTPIAGAGLAPLPSPIEPQLTFEEANHRASLPRWISLKYAEFDSRGLEPAMDDDLRVLPAQSDETRYWILQMESPVTEEKKAAVEAHGVELLDYVPNHAFVARATPQQLAAAETLASVLWTGAFHPAYRLDPALRDASLDPRSAGDGMRMVVHAFPGVGEAEVRAQIEQRGADVLAMHDDTGRFVVDVWATPGLARWLAQARDLQWIEPEGKLGPRNNTTKWVIQTFVNGNTKIWNQGLTGSGQTIGHIDGSLALGSCYLADPGGNPIGPTHRKIVYNSGGGSDTHGTHTAGTAAGDSQPINGSTNNRGMAYLAKLAHTSGFPFSTFNSVATTHMNNGARMHTNSWGDDGTTAYNTICNQIDTFQWNNEDNLVFFAATNLSTLRNPENAKNQLAVEASQQGTSANNKCSGGVGPTADGRRKPEVFAPGCSIVSANTASCGTSSLTGTSMACPAVTAAGSLVRQYFMSGFYPTGTAIGGNSFTPTGALVKAVLVNTSQDMTGIGGYPTNTEGWGRLNLDESLFFNGDTTKLFVADVRKTNGMNTGNVTNYPIQVASSSTPLEVTLAFHDFPGTINSSNPVVNDLNLTVTSPGGAQLYRGNVFASNWSTTGGAADAKNNVERVAIQNPTVGTWTVTITAANVPQPKQGYGLCVTGDIGSGPTAPTLLSVSPVSIPIAATLTPVLTLTGSGFTGATSVTLGTRVYPSSQFVVVNDTTISVDFNPPPNEVGIVNATVTNASGASGAVPFIITKAVSLVLLASQPGLPGGSQVTFWLASPNTGWLPFLTYSECLSPIVVPGILSLAIGGCGDLAAAPAMPVFNAAGLSSWTTTVPNGLNSTFFLQGFQADPTLTLLPFTTSNLLVMLATP